MTTITRVKVRARITIGNLVVETPYVTSFNVTANRGSPSTFNASLKVSNTDMNGPITGSDIKIEAGENSPSNTVFVGVIKEAKVSPCFDDPSLATLCMMKTAEYAEAHPKL